MNISALVKIAGQVGGYSFARMITSRQPRILMYHRFSRDEANGCVSAAQFEEQVRYLDKHFNLVTVSEIANGLYEGGALPANSIAITVDDGYRDFYEVAWPILRKYGVPATFYVATGFVNDDLWLWPDQLRYLLERAPKEAGEYDFGLFQVSTPLSTQELGGEFWRIVQVFLVADNVQKIEALADMSNRWAVPIPQQAPDDYASVSWGQLKEMQNEGLEVGGHTVTHPSLARVSLADARKEILGAAEAIRENLGEGVRSFCYPNGTPEDFVGEQVPLVQEAGFSCAVVAFADKNEHAQRYAMRRHSSSSDQFQFLKAVNGIELLGFKARDLSRNTPYES
jgi:peptidoglycan/xylan/chitin deacetylase (PgdA/CDA1 family)